MFRAIFYLLLTVVVITVLKSIVGIVLKGVSEAMKPGSGTPGAPPRPPGSSPAHWRAEERSGLWNLHRRGHFHSRKRWEARPSISAPRSAAISTLLRWLASTVGPAQPSSLALCADRCARHRRAGFLQRRSSHPPDALPGVPPPGRNRAHALSRPMPRRGRGPRPFANR